MMKCVPVIWQELSRLKSRVETVLNTLSNKKVNEEKVLEFKKQLVSNRSLKDYFKNNPEEKDILMNDISKAYSKRDRYLFKALDVMPPYVIPASIMAVTPEQVSQCTIGTQSFLPGNMFGTNVGKSLMYNDSFNFVEPDHPATLI